MKDIIRRTIIGVMIGIILVLLIADQHSITSTESIIILMWCVGTANAFRYHISLLARLLNPGLKLSIISYLSFGSGILGFIPIAAFLIYIITLGWIYGLGFAIVGIVKSII